MKVSGHWSSEKGLQVCCHRQLCHGIKSLTQWRLFVKRVNWENFTLSLSVSLLLRRKSLLSMELQIRINVVILWWAWLSSSYMYISKLWYNFLLSWVLNWLNEMQNCSISPANYALLFGMAGGKDNNNVRKLNLFITLYLLTTIYTITR